MPFLRTLSDGSRLAPATPAGLVIAPSGIVTAEAFGSPTVALSVPWEQDPLVMGWYEPDTLDDKIPGTSAWGPLSLQSGAVPIAAGAIDGHPAWQCRKAAGFLATASSALYFGPVRQLVVARYVGTPTSGDTLIAGAVYNGGTGIQYVDSTHVNARGVSAATSLTLDPTEWHLYDITYWGGDFSYVSVDGAAPTRVNITTCRFDGFSLGSSSINGGPGFLRADVDVASVIWIESRGPYSLAQKAYAYLQAKFPSIAIATPPSYTDVTTLVDPAFAVAASDCWLTMGQSNCQGQGTLPSAAVNANIYTLRYNYSWGTLVDPTSYTDMRDACDIGNSAGQYSGIPALCNALQPHYGRPFVVVPTTSGGSYVSTEFGANHQCWSVNTLRGQVQPDSMLGSLISRAKEPQRRGATLRGIILHQGEAEAVAGTNATQDAWPARWAAAIAYLRAALGLPNLPVIYVQIQPLTSNAFWTRMRDVIQPQLAGLVSNCYMVSAPNGPYEPGSTTNHVHLETTALEVLYGTTIPAVIIANGL